MASEKISQLPPAPSAAGSQEFAINNSGVSNKLTLSQIQASDFPTLKINTSSLDASALLEVTSSDKGTIPMPKMTEPNRDSIISPALGLWVFNTTTNHPNIFDGSLWREIELTPVPPIQKSVFIPADANVSDGSYRVRAIATNGSFQFTGFFPADLNTLVSIAAVGIVKAGANGSGKDIDLTSQYGSVGENAAIHSESDTGSTFTLPAVGVIGEVSLATVFSTPSAGDYFGVTIDHNAIGGQMAYLGISIIYT